MTALEQHLEAIKRFRLKEAIEQAEQDAREFGWLGADEDWLAVGVDPRREAHEARVRAGELRMQLARIGCGR